MSIETEKGFTRRKFLKSSLGAAVAVGCFTRAELREALAQAKVAGKPLLDAANINRHIAQNSSALKSRVAEFKASPIAYLTKHFYVRPNQLGALEELFDSDTIGNLKAFLDKRVQDKKPFRVTITRKAPERGSTNSSPLQSRVVYASLSFEKRIEMKYSYGQKTGHQIEVSAGNSC
jgi:hypothetical protein